MGPLETNIAAVRSLSQVLQQEHVEIAIKFGETLEGSSLDDLCKLLVEVGSTPPQPPPTSCDKLLSPPPPGSAVTTTEPPTNAVTAATTTASTPPSSPTALQRARARGVGTKAGQR